MSLKLYFHDEDEADVAKELSSMLTLEQGVPVGVGSGRKPLKYRAHAMMHAQRLVSPTWAASATILNSSVTITGGSKHGCVQG